MRVRVKINGELYEREVSEMLGVAFAGHPNLHALLLPDDWEGEPPLRYSPSLSQTGGRREGEGQEPSQ